MPLSRDLHPAPWMSLARDSPSLPPLPLKASGTPAPDICYHEKINLYHLCIAVS